MWFLIGVGIALEAEFETLQRQKETLFLKKRRMKEEKKKEEAAKIA